MSAAMKMPTIKKTAIMVDGGFYRTRARSLWGDVSPEKRAKEMMDYCHKHINNSPEPRDLHRIFYYDCPPLDIKLSHPLTGKTVNTAMLPSNNWSTGFHNALREQAKLALRMGELSLGHAKYILKPSTVSDLIDSKLDIKNITEDDFITNVKQKGVDLRIGLDAASLAYGRYVNQIILIAGDSDFIPVAKMARRNGLIIILDPLQNHVKPSFIEHVDGIESYIEVEDDEKSSNL